jgi:hypothetical protein
MEAYQLAEFNYQLGMTVCTLVEAMGMFSENMQRQSTGESMAYTHKDFSSLLEDNGIHHNQLTEHRHKMS